MSAIGSRLLSICLAASVVVNIWLARQTAEQGARITALLARPELKIGDQLPALNARDEAGQAVTVRYSGVEQTVLYIWSASCGWCERNVPAINALAAKISPRYRVVGLNSEPTKPKASAATLQVASYSGLSDEDWRALKLRSTPTTIVVDPDGVVRKVWSGAFAGETKAEIETYFETSLPAINVSLLPTPKGQERDGRAERKD